MKFNIKKESLIKVLKTITVIANKRTNYENINHFLVRSIKEKGTISIYCTNLDATYQDEIEAEILEEGEFCVNAQKILDIIREIHAENISFEISSNKWLLIKGPTNEVKIPSFGEDKFIEIEKKELETATELEKEVLLKAIKKSVDFVSKDPIKINLNSIQLDFSEKKIVFYSSDSYVASKYAIEDNSQTKEGDIVIPSKNLSELISFLEQIDEKIELGFDDDFLTLKEGDSFLQLKLLDKEQHKYPNLKDFFEDTKADYILDISLPDVLQEVKILKTILDDFCEGMKFSIKKDTLKIESEMMQTGQSKHELKCNFEGEELSIGLNINQVLKILQNLEDITQRVQFYFKDDGKAFLIKNSSNPDYKMVMMPMKINF